MSDETSEFERVTSLLLRDVAATLGAEHRAAVLHRAAAVQALHRADAEGSLVDDVQQLLHDERVDSTWPACPRHGDHPLWHRDGAWWCDRDRVVVAALGGLRPDRRG